MALGLQRKEKEMNFLILGAAGAMSLATEKDLLENSSVSKILLADQNYQGVEKRARSLGDARIIPMQLDLKEINKVSEVMRSVDIAINESSYELNIYAMKAAMSAGIPLLDLGGLYTMTKKQLELDSEVKKAGILVIPGMGSDPGTSNVLCRYGADKLDKIEEIHIRYGFSVSNMTFAFAVGTILNEATENALVYENGQYREVPPLSIIENTIFRDPIGEIKTYNILHSEFATVPKYIKGVRTLTYQDSWDSSLIKKINALKSLGLLSHRKLKIMGTETTAKNLMVEILSEIKIDEKYEGGWDALKVSVKGKERGKETTYVLEVLSKGNEEDGITPTSYVTGTPPSIVAQMIVQGRVKGKGVLPPEVCIDPREYITELTKREIEFFETKIQTDKFSKNG